MAFGFLFRACLNFCSSLGYFLSGMKSHTRRLPNASHRATACRAENVNKAPIAQRSIFSAETQNCYHDRHLRKPVLLTLSFWALTVAGSCADHSRTLNLSLNDQPLQQSPTRGDWPQVYPLRIEAGEYVQVALHQEGIDVFLRLLHPDSRLLIEVDSPTGAVGTEILSFVAAESGDYRIEVAPFGERTSEGRYEIELKTQRSASAADRADFLLARSEWRKKQGKLREALGDLEESLRLRQQAGDQEAIAEVLARMGDCERLLWQEQASIGHYRRAIEAFQNAGATEQSVDARIDLGAALEFFGLPDQASDAYRQAIREADAGGFLRSRVSARYRLGRSLTSRGATESAVGLFREGLGLSGPLTLDWKARLQYSLGLALSRGERLEEARRELHTALKSWEEAGSETGQSSAVTEIGWIEHLEGHEQAALERYLEALELMGQDNRQAAGVWDRLATSYRSLGKDQQAINAYQKALSLMEGQVSPFDQAHTVNNLAEAYLDLQQPLQALLRSQEATGLFKRSAQPAAEAHARFVSAKALRKMGRWQEATQALQSVFDLVETLRYRVSGRSWRSAIQASRYSYYEEYWGLMAAAPQAFGSQEAARAGYEALERVRSLTLREWMAERDSPEDRAAGEDEFKISHRIAALDLQRRQLASQGSPAYRLSEIEEEISSQIERLEGLGQPAPQPVSLQEVQQRLLDRNTLLLAYALGERQSFLWVISDSEVRMYPLPDRITIERLAGLCYKLLRRPATVLSQRQLETAIQRLSEILLKDAVPWLNSGREASQRLLILADGNLHYLPFGLLDLNFSKASVAAQPLLARHEIIMIPSAGAMLQLRERSHRQFKGLFALVADPVFEKQDPRLATRAATGIPNAVRPGSLPRLPFQQAILELFPPQSSRRALGVDASRGMVASGGLEGYSIIHFATHGVFDADRPELSYILLSRYDEQGKPLSGVLRAHDIAKLRLDAELVTLAACETGRGEEIRGEGVLGLAHAFMVAGASRTLVGLWRVQHEATSELMLRFYRRILEGEPNPARALRAAQLSMAQDPKWSAPFFWAGFVLLGDWRSLPQIISH